MTTLAGFILAAILAWQSTGIDTSRLHVEAKIGTQSEYWVAWTDSPATGGCTITVAPSFWDYSPDVEQIVIDHEVGHCLGYHHTAAGVMALGNMTDRPNHADIARQHPAAVLPMLAH